MYNVANIKCWRLVRRGIVADEHELVRFQQPGLLGIRLVVALWAVRSAQQPDDEWWGLGGVRAGVLVRSYELRKAKKVIITADAAEWILITAKSNICARQYVWDAHDLMRDMRKERSNPTIQHTQAKKKEPARETTH